MSGPWYFNLVTKQVEEGPVSPNIERLGPYNTRAEAEKALELAAKRNEQWDNDPRWKDED
jgi:hypothetical protein